MNLQLGWIPVRKSVSADADVESHDSIEIAVRLLPILDEATLGELLRGGLEAKGWEKQADGSYTKKFGEATATLPPEGSTITLAIEGQTSVTVEGVATGNAPKEGGSAEEKALEEQARETAARKLGAAERAARREIERKNSEELLRVEQDLRKEVNEVVNTTTKKALERRAAALGAIDSVEERQGEKGYELTITVRT